MEAKSSLYQEFEGYSKQLMQFFLNAKINLPAKAKRGNVLAIIMNYNIWYSFAFVFLLFYLVITEDNSLYINVSQIWAACVIMQVSTRGINSLMRSEEILSLFDWYQSIYVTHRESDYQKVFDKYQTRQNFFIRIIITFMPFLLIFSAVVYLVQPFITGSGELPTPLFWHGIPDSEINRWIYWAFFIALTYSSYNIINSVTAIDSFFAISVIILGFRFTCIADVLKLLNYGQERDKEKDRRIIRDCYLMHLDVLDRVDTFQTYFNIYGLFHFSSPIIVQSILSYFMSVNGFNLMNLMLIILMFTNIVTVCFFGQVLKESALRFSDEIYQCNWEDLDVVDQKSIWLLYLRSQLTVSIVAGDMYELDFAMLTQVVKFQASFYAVLKTM